MAIKTEKWTLAQDLFMVGKSLTFISKELGIGRSSISEKAKRDGWKKGKNEQLILDEVGLRTRTEQLTGQQLEIHDKEVGKRLKFKKKLDTFSDGVMDKANELINAVEDGQEFKAIIDGVDKHSVTIGYNKRHAEPIKVQQTTNTQVNYSEISDEDLLQKIKRSHERVKHLL